ncbi:hypothetical protein V494_01593 [Pseudogymnoascus sp. VKM F-4513 (FW-928)]|nr:hypothetical protein V494_01593 [Pseudogymnoascus sp. VKM F-4513 (FW-928)]
MQLYMHRGHVRKMQVQTACMIMLLEGFAAATPSITLPLNSQFPPVARVSEPFSFTLSNSTFSSDGIIAYALSQAPTWLSLDGATRTLSGTPPDWAFGTTPTVDIVATDESGPVTMKSILTVSSHTAPEITIPIETQLQSLAGKTVDDSVILKPSSRFGFSFSKSTFTYKENPSILKVFAVTMDNTPLPSWISFDNSTMTFSGETPDPEALATPQERVAIRLIASEKPGFAGASMTFNIVVENHRLEWDDAVLKLKAFVGTTFQFNGLSEALKLDDKVANKSDISSIAVADAPPWLKFDNTTYVLYGTPQEPRDGASPLDMTVSAQDRFGGTASVVIRVTVANNIFTGADIPSPNAIIGQPFAYNISQAFVDSSAVDIKVSFSPEVPWLSFDSKTCTLSGDVSKSAEESSINVTMAATPKLSLSKVASNLKSFTINVVSRSLGTSSVIHTSPILRTDASILDSNGLGAIDDPTAGASNRALNRGELTAIIVLAIFTVILIVGFLLYCGRRQNRLKMSDPAVPLSKRDISTPRLQKKYSILGLNGSLGSLHPGLRPKVKNVKKLTLNNPDIFGMKYSAVAARQSVSSSRYSNLLSSHFDPGHSGHRDFCRPFPGVGASESSINDDHDIIIIQNFPGESNEETKPHAITTAPSAVRTKGGTYSFHPYRTTPRASGLQRSPELSSTASMGTYRAHKRHRTPSDLGHLPNTPSNSSSGAAIQRTGSVRSNSSSNRTVQPWNKGGSANGDHQSAPATPIEDTAWGSLPSSPIKSSSARPRSNLSAVTESTDVLYLGYPSPTTTSDDIPSMKSGAVTPFTKPLQTFLDMSYSAPSSPALSRQPGRRVTGSSPFFSGSDRTISRVKSRSKKIVGGSKEMSMRSNSRQVVPEPLALRKFSKGENSFLGLQDPGLTQLLGGPGSSRNDSVGISSYTGSIEMTEDGTKHLISFLASVDKRRSWMSETDSRQSFSAWDFEQEEDGANEVSGVGLQRFKSYKSNVSGRSKMTFRGLSIWEGSEGQDTSGATFVEQVTAMDFCGGLFESSSGGGGRWGGSLWSESRGDSSGRLSAPVSPKGFELGPWIKPDGDGGVGSAV